MLLFATSDSLDIEIDRLISSIQSRAELYGTKRVTSAQGEI